MRRSSCLAASAVSDGALMERITSDDRDAFAAFYERYEQRAWRIALLLCRDACDAEAAIVKTFRTLWRQRDSYNPAAEGEQQHTMRLLYRYVTEARRCRDAVQARRARLNREAGERSAAQPSPDASDPSDPRGPTDPSDAIDPSDPSDPSDPTAMLLRLPEPERDAIVLAFYGGLSHAQVAELLNLSPRAANGRMRLGMKELSARLRPADQQATNRDEDGK